MTALIPIINSAAIPGIIPSKTFFNAASLAVSSSSDAKYCVTLLFNNGESNSINQSDIRPSFGSQTVASAIAPDVVPLNARTDAPLTVLILPVTPAAFKPFVGPIKPNINLKTLSVISPCQVSAL